MRGLNLRLCFPPLCAAAVGSRSGVQVKQWEVAHTPAILATVYYQNNIKHNFINRSETEVNISRANRSHSSQCLHLILQTYFITSESFNCNISLKCLSGFQVLGAVTFYCFICLNQQVCSPSGSIFLRQTAPLTEAPSPDLPLCPFVPDRHCFREQTCHISARTVGDAIKSVLPEPQECPHTKYLWTEEAQRT